MHHQKPIPTTPIHYKSLVIESKPYILKLHRNFSTAHSTSSTRTNFFIRCTSQKPQIYMKEYGFGECGLPPKKPGCYMSDIDDCGEFMGRVKEDLRKLGEVGKGKDIENGKHSQVCNLISSVLQPLKSSLKTEIQQLLKFLQQYNQIQHFRAPKCCLQFSLLDLLFKYHHKSLTQLFFPSFSPSHHESYSFYTASLQQNTQMLQNIKQHLSITKCIKIKYNNDIGKLMELLRMMEKEIGDSLKWVIVDANCSWGVGEYDGFVKAMQEEGLGKIRKKILYVEQPFQLEKFEEWEKVKSVSPFRILADESFRNEQDIQSISKVSHAVNIKTQKTGGAFATYIAATKAKQKGLQVMFGSMCSTQLGCTQTYQFHPLAKFLDVDGALLTKQPYLEGGFVWRQDGKIEACDHGYGLKVKAQKIFQQQLQKKQNKIE